jgi:ABC-type sugar transport system ATPase subunit
VILVVSEPEELAHASDRVAVLRGGRITTVVDGPVDAHKLTELMNTQVVDLTQPEGQQ